MFSTLAAGAQLPSSPSSPLDATHMASAKDERGRDSRYHTKQTLSFVIALQGVLLLAGLMLVLLGLFDSNKSQSIREHSRPPFSLFVFGDSFSASAFNNGSDPPSLDQPFGFPPLDPGPDHLNWTKHNFIIGATANGPLWPEYLVAQFNSSLILLYDFAVSGGMITDSLVEQVREIYQPRYSSLFTDGKASGVQWTSGASIFAAFIGINDQHICCGDLFGGGNTAPYEECMRPRLKLYFDLMDELYKTGARKFFFVNVPPIDRTPMMLEKSEDLVANYTHGVATFNKLLPEYVSGFEASHSGVQTALYDSHALFTKILDRPQDYGFKDAECFSCICVDYDPGCVWSNPFHPVTDVHVVLAEEMLLGLRQLGWPGE